VRLQAFRDFMEQRHLAVEPNMVQEGNHRVEGGRDAMQRMLDSTANGARPTAVMASNDLTAIGALGAIHDAGCESRRTSRSSGMTISS